MERELQGLEDFEAEMLLESLGAKLKKSSELKNADHNSIDGF